MAKTARFLLLWTLAVAVGAGLAANSAGSAAAAILPEFLEFQVNAHTSLAQSQAAAAAAPDGRFVVVWQSATSPGNDSSDLSIQAQRFDATGAAAGAQFQVNTYTPSTQSLPDVAVGLDGSFVVVWQSFGAPMGGDPALFGIRARGFDAGGAESFAEIPVNAQTSGDQTRPPVARVGVDELAFAWQTSDTVAPGGDGSQSSIQARRFGANGAPLAGQFLVNATTAGFQTQPEISADGAGGFAVVWASDEDPGGGTRRAAFRPGSSSAPAPLRRDTVPGQRLRRQRPGCAVAGGREPFRPSDRGLGEQRLGRQRQLAAERAGRDLDRRQRPVLRRLRDRGRVPLVGRHPAAVVQLNACAVGCVVSPHTCRFLLD